MGQKEGGCRLLGLVTVGSHCYPWAAGCWGQGRELSAGTGIQRTFCGSKVA